MAQTFYVRVLFAVLCLGIASVTARARRSRMYEKCVEFCDKKPIEVSGALKMCVKGWEANCTYCRYFNNNCPEIQECQFQMAPVPSEGNRCMVCPGDGCVYNGEIRQVGDVFDPVIGHGECRCHSGGRVDCRGLREMPAWVFCH
ncbi:uncharacterized protein [Argopecten irradians]|uniref:uncharacterized protein n=1 Tax=Argopecten irradians TaxID=31199 RepID=UPI0037227D06